MNTSRFPTIGWLAIALGALLFFVLAGLLFLNVTPVHFLPAWWWAVLLLSLLVALAAWADQSHPHSPPPHQPAVEQRLPLPIAQVIDIDQARSMRDARRACARVH
ncbi:MAG: hypothetical protein RSP_04810 [Rhodanobacter sp.]